MSEYASRSRSKPERIEYLRAYRQANRDHIHDLTHRWKLKNGLIRKPMEPLSQVYPYMMNQEADGAALLFRINNLVPRGLSEMVRGDICQEIALAVLSGEITESEIVNCISRYTKSQFQFLPRRFGVISFDADPEKRSWLESLIIR